MIFLNDFQYIHDVVVSVQDQMTAHVNSLKVHLISSTSWIIHLSGGNTVIGTSRRTCRATGELVIEGQVTPCEIMKYLIISIFREI